MPREGKAEVGPCHGGGLGSIIKVEVSSMANEKDGTKKGDERRVSFSAMMVLVKLPLSFDEEFDGWVSKVLTVSL